ncbi:bifunctional nuclease family protein [Thermosulfuriphilus sp.]
MIKMEIQTIALDPVSNTPIMILKEKGGQRTLPIWIGLLEATAIATQIEKIEFSRPMTHDLLKNILDSLGIKIPRVEVCDLKDNTYYALITLDLDGREMQIDARPSDAIALALRTGAEIYVHEEVLRKSRQLEEQKSEAKEGDKWSDILESLDPETFSKYKM